MADSSGTIRHLRIPGAASAQPGGWLQVGGHGDPGEGDPLAIALREAAEETGLSDLVPWPDDSPRWLTVTEARNLVAATTSA
jgi:8-oxo-dGTP pyrophosphatase MutT (NUDIX family)